MAPRRSYSFLRIISIFSYQILDFYDANKFRINLSSAASDGRFQISLRRNFSNQAKVVESQFAL